MTTRVLVPDAAYAQALASAPVNAKIIVWNIDDPAEAPEAEILLTARPLNGDYQVRIRRMPSLTHIHLLSLGYDWIVPHIPAGVTLSNSRGSIESSTAELCVGLIIASLRRFGQAIGQQRAREWATFEAGTIAGSSVLILGYGGVGSAVGRRLQQFECSEIVAVGRKRRMLETGEIVHGMDELDELIPAADVIIVSLPLTESTQHLVDKDFLARIKDGALFVNIGRGGIVDTDALAAKLASSSVIAALDVVDPEPLPRTHPLWTEPGCLITPHIGGSTGEFRRASARVAVANIRQVVAGLRPDNEIVLPACSHPHA